MTHREQQKSNMVIIFFAAHSQTVYCCETIITIVYFCCFWCAIITVVINVRFCIYFVVLLPVSVVGQGWLVWSHSHSLNTYIRIRLISDTQSHFSKFQLYLHGSCSLLFCELIDMWDDLEHLASRDVIGHVTIRFAIGHFPLMVLWNQASIYIGFWRYWA